MKRNTIVLGITLFMLSSFAWAGWANWEYRRQTAEKLLANSAQGMLVAMPDGAPRYFSPLAGKPAPAFTLEDLTGKKVSLENYKGKAVLINFWATWCGPCKLETPWLVELREQYGAKGFEILGVDTEGDELEASDKAGLARQKAAVVRFAQQMKVPYPMLLNGDSISKAYGGLDSMPTSFYVDRNGVVVAAQMGITSKDEIEGNIKKALGEGK